MYSLQDCLTQIVNLLANEIQCGQMSLYQSDSASASQILFQTLENVLSAKYLGITFTCTDNMHLGQRIYEISST